MSTFSRRCRQCISRLLVCAMPQVALQTSPFFTGCSPMRRWRGKRSGCRGLQRSAEEARQAAGGAKSAGLRGLSASEYAFEGRPTQRSKSAATVSTAIMAAVGIEGEKAGHAWHAPGQFVRISLGPAGDRAVPFQASCGPRGRSRRRAPEQKPRQPRRRRGTWGMRLSTGILGPWRADSGFRASEPSTVARFVFAKQNSQ